MCHERPPVLRLSVEQQHDLREALRSELKRLGLCCVPPRLVEVIEESLSAFTVPWSTRKAERAEHRKFTQQYTKQRQRRVAKAQDLLRELSFHEKILRADLKELIEAEQNILSNEAAEADPAPPRNRPIDECIREGALAIVTVLEQLGVSLDPGVKAPPMVAIRLFREWAGKLKRRPLADSVGPGGSDYQYAVKILEEHERRKHV